MPTMFYGDDEDTAEVRFKFEMKGSNELIILGINPSNARAAPNGTAKPDKDPTIRRVIGFSKRNWNYDDKKIKFDGFLMLNVYAQSTPDIDNLPHTCNTDLHNKNLEKIKGYLKDLSTKQTISVLLAYGDGIEQRKYLRECLHNIVDILKGYGTSFFRIHDAHFFRLGELTAEGNPRHLSRLSYDTSLIKISDNELEEILK